MFTKQDILSLNHSTVWKNKFAALRYYNLVLADNKIKLINRAAQRAAEIEFANGNYKKMQLLIIKLC
ncbi:hypothetical protein ACFFJX_07380 [Pseudarcicella hirudinis]|uniref:hypothetical protein n=1 Tax=Pseudarcicella hirudinis TaxID=1079859 RepID=UPI0035E48BAC